ncbi:MAG: LysM peptidoglycan-binding domain-containing protein [Verrucomicrobia bacterium]|nr:LysM peptidoglycan-binding domain-containing protein [Verrucomicrobiota bacterium]
MKHWIYLILLAGCAPQMSTQTAATQDTLDEIRVALLDVRQAYSSTKIDIENLEEKVADLKPNTLMKVSSIEARINQLEKQLTNIQTDLHNLSTHLNQTTETLQQYRNQIAALDSQLKTHTGRLDEVSNLKTTLNSISQAINAQPAPTVQIHKVVSGESLDKIARQYSVTVDSLKRTNGLSSNTIMIGQELKIPE